MRALFVTTATTEPGDNAAAWQQSMGSMRHVVFDINGPPNDDGILRAAREFAPEVIFYVGGESGAGLPTPETLKALRDFAPSIQMQGDSADPPWHPMLKFYKETGCFDLQVGIDGVRGAPVDYVTLTPIHQVPFERQARPRTIPCGFAGNVVSKARYELLKNMFRTEDPRSAMLHSLNGDVQLRERETDGDYASYAAFLRRCRMMINTSWAGSGLVHHIKGRVIEAGLAGCALLEMAGAPTADWFPAETFFTYADAGEARDVIRATPVAEIDARAKAFSAHAWEHYTARHIFAGILNRAGLA